jgi:hypothetical protein
LNVLCFWLFAKIFVLKTKKKKEKKKKKKKENGLANKAAEAAELSL